VDEEEVGVGVTVGWGVDGSYRAATSFLKIFLKFLNFFLKKNIDKYEGTFRVSNSTIDEFIASIS